MFEAIYEPRHGISNKVVCATSKASDQPAHTRSLIRAFVSRLNTVEPAARMCRLSSQLRDLQAATAILHLLNTPWNVFKSAQSFSDGTCTVHIVRKYPVNRGMNYNGKKKKNII